MFYFAYGSNMNWSQMQLRCPSARFACVARLPVMVVTSRHSRLRDCGTANVYAAPGSEVWGIVYDVTENDMGTIDRLKMDIAGREFWSIISTVTRTSIGSHHLHHTERDWRPFLPNAQYKRLMPESTALLEVAGRILPHAGTDPGHDNLMGLFHRFEPFKPFDNPTNVLNGFRTV